MRICAGCDSTETREWRSHDGYWLCKKCYDKYVWTPTKKWNPINSKKWNGINSPKRLLFGNKRVILKEHPRKGMCQLCGAVKGVDCNITNIHHLEYHPEDPLKDTIELCVSCHAKQHIESRNMSNLAKSGDRNRKLVYNRWTGKLQPRRIFNYSQTKNIQ